jgi:hypothetical protein
MIWTTKFRSDRESFWFTEGLRSVAAHGDQGEGARNDFARPGLFPDR